VGRTLGPTLRTRTMLAGSITRRQDEDHRYENGGEPHEQDVLGDREVQRDRPDLHGRELRQMDHSERRLPLIGVRQVMEDHLLDVELAALRCSSGQQRHELAHHDRVSFRRRKTGSSRSSRNTNPTRLTSAAARGSASVRLSHTAVTPTAPKRSSMPPSQPTRNSEPLSRNATSAANAASWTTSATPAPTHTASDEPSTSHAVSAAASAVTPSAVSAYAPHARITAPSRAPSPAAPRGACAPARAPSRDGGTCNRIPLPHRSRPPAA